MNVSIDQHPFKLTSSDGLPLRGNLHSSSVTESQPLIILCHGFKGFKDWGWFPYIADYFAKRGYCVIRFNFTMNGVAEDPLEFTRLDLFKQNSFSREIEDLLFLISAIKAKQLPQEARYDPAKIMLIAHSRGGFSALNAANRFDEVKALVTWATPSATKKPSENEEEEWRRSGERFIKNYRTGQEMPLGVALLDDILHSEELIEQQARALKKPWLIAHGTEDEAVPLSCAEDFARWSPNAEKFVIEGAGHTFGATHPFAGSTPHLDELLATTNSFLEKHS